MQSSFIFQTVERVLNDFISDVIKSKYKIDSEILKRFLSESPLVEIPADKSYGDIAITFAMRLAKVLCVSTMEVSELIAQRITTSDIPIDKIEIVEPGFVNIKLGWEVLKNSIENAISNPAFGSWTILRKEDGNPMSIQLEFVSANPTGPLNVVSARAASLGFALSNLIRKMGADVETEYFVNDEGRQIKLLAESIMTTYRLSKGESVEYPDDGYRGGYIQDIAGKLIDVSFQKDDLKQVARWAVDNIVKLQKDVLVDFGIKFDSWFYQSSLREEEYKSVIERLEKNRAYYEKDGALWIKTSDYDDVQDWVLVKSDGENTYHFADLAYHLNKRRRGFDKVINILGPDHYAHISMMKAGVKALGLPDDWLEIIIAQQVNIIEGKEKVKMGKRLGRYITMDELIKEVNPDVCKFFFLDRSPSAHVDFDFELAKKTSMENPVYYIQYAYARIESIKREALKIGQIIPNGIQIDVGVYSDEERELAREIFYYPMVMRASALGRKTQVLTSYLQNIAGLFHKYYTKNRILGIEKRLSYARQFLSYAVASVVKDGLITLGISAPERM
ncbi:MAG: arginine--tRNA ligase [bacterium]